MLRAAALQTRPRGQNPAGILEKGEAYLTFMTSSTPSTSMPSTSASSIGERAAQWLSRLVQIPSVTPVQAGPRAGGPAGAGEAAIAQAITRWFTALGGQVHVDEVLPNRPSIYGIWPGKSNRWAAVDVHTDTVGVEQMTGDPFSGEIRDGRVWGRGAVDTKATLGIILALLEAMQQSNTLPAHNLLIGATVDEEFGATGAPAFARWIKAQSLPIDEMIVAEPTGCVPVFGHRGVARFRLTVEGVSAHSSQPDLGKNAIQAAARIALAYAEEHARLQREKELPILGVAALTVTEIHGGTGINVVPDRCTVSADRRIVDGEDAVRVIDALVELAQVQTDLPISVTRLRELNAFLELPDSDWIQRLSAWSGRQPVSAPYGTNAWAYKNLPKGCAVIGPGSIDQAHGAEEWVEISELEKMAQIYAKWWEIPY
jgi:acetylornithine deacetylase/succinyl-diaminopimelate desuccinylase-like protein